MVKVFYDEIIKEAITGRINISKKSDNYIPYNIIFNTNIVEDNIYLKSNLENDNLLIPTLIIKNKKLFNELLEIYLKLALKFYDDINYEPDENKIKKILTLLWSNASIDDFNEPIIFLRKRISFFKNELDLYNEEKKFKSDILNGYIGVKNIKCKLLNETPYCFKITLYNNKEEKYELPLIYYGIDNNKIYIYAIQNKSNFNKEKNKYQKFIKRKLYSLDEGLDVKIENYDNYDIGNLKDITPSFLLAISIFINIIIKNNIDEIIVPSILIERYNSKVIYFDLIEKEYNKFTVDELKTNYLKIQSNLTEKLIRTFLRLAYHYDAIEVNSFPSEIDNNLILKIYNIKSINNLLLSSIFDDLNQNKKIK